MTSRGLRAAGTAVLSVPLAGGLLLAGAPAATAAVTQPGEGAVFSTDTTVSIRADYPSGTSSLTLTAPGGSPVTVATGGSRLGGAGTLTYALDTACWTYPSSSCSGRVPAPNGTWVLTQSGSATDRVTFSVRIPPQTPTDVTATVVDPRTVRVGWRRGAESDLRGFVVLADGVPQDVSTGACEGTSCSHTVSYAEQGSGEHTYAVKALRSDGGSGTLESGTSEGASATLAPPPPSPEPVAEPPAEGSTGGSSGGSTGGAGGGSSPGTGGGSTGGSGSSGGGSTGGSTGGSGEGSGGSSGGSGGGGTAAGPAIGSGTSSPGSTAVDKAVAQRKAFALSFSAFGPKLGIPKLPPLPQAQAPAIAPEPDGSYEPTLGFSDQVVTERVESAGPAARVTDVVERALDSEQLVRSTAAALVLLLCGAHLRRWLATGAPERD